MGQRFQVVVITPKEYYNANNPNNKEGRLYVYHFQWLWGDFAILRLGNFIYGIKELIKKELEHNKKYNFTMTYGEIPTKVLKWVCCKDLGFENSFHQYPENECKIYEKECFSDFIDGFDNNNGVFILEITKENKLKYCFYNPVGNESNSIRQGICLNAETYLKDYTNEDKQNGAGLRKEKEYKRALKLFKETPNLKELPAVKEWMIKKDSDKIDNYEDAYTFIKSKGYQIDKRYNIETYNIDKEETTLIKSCWGEMGLIDYANDLKFKQIPVLV